MKRLCTILARGGSKGVPGKNIRLLSGKPLIAHTIGRAKEAGLFEAIAVSSDSEEILNVASEYGADLVIRRPEALSNDTAPKIPAIRHALEEAERRRGRSYDFLCDLDPTSPFRTLADIREAVRLCESSPVPCNVITAAPSRKSPYFNMVEQSADGRVGLSKTPSQGVYRRQDAPKCYDMNASIYVWRRAVLFRQDPLFNETTRLYVMPPERSVEIDSELDFVFAECWASKGHL